MVKGDAVARSHGAALRAFSEDRPEPDEQPGLGAARAAWGMQQALGRFNQGTDHRLTMRIGLNCGKIVRGDIGSRHVRRDYTCIGDVVNRAQRHEGKAPLGGVLLSVSVYERIQKHVRVSEVTGLTFKGIDEPQSAYVLEGFLE